MASSRWLGRAEAIKNIQTVTVQNTWATSDTATLTINGRDLTLTVGGTATTTQIAADIADMWNGDAVNNDESRNTTGDTLAEFAEITATVSGSVVTLTHNVAGVPFTVAVSETTAGDGSLALATSQAATGPNDVNNAANWSEGSVPGASDDAFIDNTSVSLLYNLDQLSGTLTSITIGQSFTGNIGLPENNAGGYTEYRPTYLDLDCSTITLGTGEGSGSSRIKINSGTVQTAIEVINTGSPAESGLGAFIWKGTHASNTLRMYDGEVSVAPRNEDSATLTTINTNGGSLLCGNGVSLTTVVLSGDSNVVIRSNTTTLTQHNGEISIYGTATIGTYNFNGGNCSHFSSGTITTMNHGGSQVLANFDRSNENRSLTITTYNKKNNVNFSMVPGTITFTNTSYDAELSGWSTESIF